MKESKVIDMDCDGVILDIIRDTYTRIRKEKEADFNFYSNVGKTSNKRHYRRAL